MLAFVIVSFLFFFFNDTATTEIYTLSLHDALPISFLIAERIGEHEVCLVATGGAHQGEGDPGRSRRVLDHRPARGDRKSTRLNSSHLVISYAVFCLKKKKK